MTMDKYGYFIKKIEQLISVARIYQDPLRTLAYGADASIYRLIPKCVIKVQTEAEVIYCLQAANQFKLPVTFRAAGTSLSGQAVTDSILLVLGENWQGYQINRDGSEIRLQPGIIATHANDYLAPYGRKIGPDPASINTAKIGGIAANNASGMCCGVQYNSYQTLAGMRIIFADGAVLDTNNDISRNHFTKAHTQLLVDIQKLASQVKNNTVLTQQIKTKYRIKNTTGYSLNALIDFTDPIDVIQHLMIGSEGTLGFIAEITYRTVIEHPYKASAMIFFIDIFAATQAVLQLSQCQINAAELLDGAALAAVKHLPDLPNIIKTLDRKAAALLIEVCAANQKTLANHIQQIKTQLADVKLLTPISFTQTDKEYATLWHARKGLFALVGGKRKAGTTVIIEDVAVPIEQLGDCIVDIQNLFIAQQYTDATIFGHALAGNIHIVFSQDFNHKTEVLRYQNLMQGLATLVSEKFHGSLKAEHGTGRNIAPFVLQEWGADAYAIMQKIKSIFDPDNILNPGVILNHDSQIHIKNLKTIPITDTNIDNCLEIGYCEPVCPSQNLSLTPRQRIVVARELARLAKSGKEPQRYQQIQQSYQYLGIDTCAATSLCAVSCPIAVDTGAYIKKLRRQQAKKKSHYLANFIAQHFALTIALARQGLNLLHYIHCILGTKAMLWLTSKTRSLFASRLPQWTSFMPRGAKKIRFSIPKNNNLDSPAVVFFPSCICRSMGPAKNSPETKDLHQAIQDLLQKAGYQISFPNNLNQLCCGLPFESKGLQPQFINKCQEIEQALMQASNKGEIPILCDNSPCVALLRSKLNPNLSIYEPAEFINKYLLKHLRFTQTKESIVIHPTCSTIKMGLTEQIIALAKQCAEQVIIPKNIDCCGFSGDKGFTTPELNDAALQNLKAQIPEDCNDGYSNTITCEIGLSSHSGRFYRSIVYLVDQCTTANF